MCEKEKNLLKKGPRIPFIAIREDKDGYYKYKTDLIGWEPLPKELRDSFLRSTIHIYDKLYSKLKTGKRDFKLEDTLDCLDEIKRVLRCGSVKTSIFEGNNYCEDDYKTCMEKISNRKKSRLINIDGLYQFKIIVKKLYNYENVKLRIFRWDEENCPFDPREYIPESVSDLSYKYESLIRYLKECFTKSEIEQIKEYFDNDPNIIIEDPIHASFPENEYINRASSKYHPPSGEGGYIVLNELEGYTLPFKIAGFYDLTEHKRSK